MRPMIEAAAAHAGATVNELLSRRRSKPLVRARFAVIEAARRVTSYSLPQIGRELGGRDHTTVMNGLKRAQALVRTDPAFAALVQSCIEASRNPPFLTVRIDLATAGRVDNDSQ